MKKIVIIILAIIAVVGAVFITKNSKNNNEIQIPDNYQEYDSYEDLYEDLNDNSSERKDLYDLAFLEKLDDDDLDELNGRIIDIKSVGSDLFICTDNKVYLSDYEGIKEIITSSKTIKSIFMIGYKVIGLQYSDNSYSIYSIYTILENSEYSLFCKELEEIEAENIIYAMIADNSNKLLLIKEYDNRYYVDIYVLDEYSNIKSKELKIPLHLGLGMNNPTVSDIKQVYVADENKLICTSNDGKAYETRINISFSDVENGYIKLLMNDSGTYDFDNVNRIYGKDASLSYLGPLFETLNDKNNLYTYNMDYVKYTTLGAPDEKYRITIPLPDGYTVDDIKNVIFYKDLIIEFNDKSIYISEPNGISELSYNEELSSLNKNGKIIKIYLDHSDYIALMDDNCLYEIDI